MIYLDTSAAYKLLSRDPGVAEVESLFKDGTPLLSSRLLEVELHATVDRRGGSHADVDEIVARIELDAVDGEVVDHALSLRSGLRVMDALHLSTALLYGEEMTAIATFDRELAETAQQFGLEVRAGRGVPMFFVKGKREVFSGLEVTAGARWCCRQDGAAAGSGGVRWCQAAAATGVSWMVGGE